MFQEIELTLTGKPADLSAIFQELDGDRPRSSRIVSTYYDTHDGRLWRRGYALQLRARDDEFELSLTRRDGKALNRDEWTSIIPEPEVDLGLLPKDAPRGELGAILPEELQPRFASEIERTQRRLYLDRISVEVSLDIGRIVSGERETPVAELGFRLLDGPVAEMFELVKSSLGRRRFTVGARSAAARGMELFDDVPPASVKTAKPELEASDTIDSAVSKIVAVTAAQIMGNFEAAHDGRDPEGVHQLRVGLRRLRSALTLFKPHLAPGAASLAEDMKRALKQLGPARDLDVFLLETMPPVTVGTSEGPGLLKLGGIGEKRRQEAYTDVRRLVSDRRFSRFLLDLLLVAEEGGLVASDSDQYLRPIAVALLQRRHKKVLKLGRHFAQLTYPQRHEVRIALKKLRYACDYFQGLFPKKSTRAYLKRLSSLQDDLGRLNDATVAELLVDELAADDAKAAIGGALIKGWYGHRLQAVEPHMLHAWHEFAEARPFWR